MMMMTLDMTTAARVVVMLSTLVFLTNGEWWWWWYYYNHSHLEEIIPEVRPRDKSCYWYHNLRGGVVDKGAQDCEQQGI